MKITKFFDHSLIIYLLLICLHHNCRIIILGQFQCNFFLRNQFGKEFYQNYEIQAFSLIVVFYSWKQLITNHNFCSKGIYAKKLLCGESSCGEIVQNIILTIFAKTIFHDKGYSQTFIEEPAIACETILKVYLFIYTIL